MLNAERLPVSDEDARVLLIQEIGQYLATSIVADVRERMPEVVLAHGGLGSPNGRGAAVAFVEASVNRSVANIVNRLSATREHLRAL